MKSSLLQNLKTCNHLDMRKAKWKQKLSSKLLEESGATLYDAVAGRINYEGFISIPKPAKNRDLTFDTLIPNPPDEVLSRLPDAPNRYLEDDIYSADDKLTQLYERKPKGPEEAKELERLKKLYRLPDSDLLKALHVYCSDFYVRATRDKGRYDLESLDETALLALGILVEEVAGQFWGGDDEAESSEEEVEIKSEPDVKVEPDKASTDMKIEPDGSSPDVKMEDASSSSSPDSRQSTLEGGVKNESRNRADIADFR